MPEQTFIEIVQHQARVKPQALAFRCGDRRWTFADIEHDSNRIANTLAAMGIGAGDRVAALTRFHVESLLLTLAAAKLGAKPVSGFDYDPAAVRISRKNATLNGMRGVKFTCGDITAWEPGPPHDMVLANIFYDVLTLSFGKITAATKPGGIVIVSGILATQATACLAAGKKAGLNFAAPIKRGKWVTALAVRR